MSNYNQERIQQIWDHELITLWDEQGKNKMWKVVHNFLCRVKGSHELGDVGFEDSEDYLVSLNLKRCLDIDHCKGHHVFQAWKSDVIGFVHARSEALSLDLMADDAIKPLILMNISQYKWIKKNTNPNALSRFRSAQRYNRKVRKATVPIRARDLSGTNWDKVK